MSKQKVDVVGELCGFMTPGVIYPFQALKELIDCPAKKLRSAIDAEVKKPGSNSRLGKTWLKIVGKSAYNYFLNPAMDFSKEKELAERNSIEGMSRAILRMVHAENKKTIHQWIVAEFEKKMDEAVQRFVVNEFKTEILPVLIQHIDSRMENLRGVTKGQVKECIREEFSNIVARLTQEEGASKG